MEGACQPWGEETIALRLPACLVTINGLSGKQKQAISRDYECFAGDPAEGERRADVVCHAGRLEHLEGLSPEFFAVTGQYTLRKRRTGAGIEITAPGFAAYIDRSREDPARTALMTAEEKELSRPGVMENFLRVLAAYQSLNRGGVLLHSAGMVFLDRAYLFSGRSNAGKTTLARKAAAAGVRVLSDDINLVIPENGGFRAHKAPFTGEFGRRAEHLAGSGSFPLGGLVLLEKAAAMTATPVSPADGVAGLLTGCPYVNDDPEEIPVLLDILMNLAADTPIIRLGVGQDDTFEAVMDTLLRHYEYDGNNG